MTSAAGPSSKTTETATNDPQSISHSRPKKRKNKQKALVKEATSQTDRTLAADAEEWPWKFLANSTANQTRPIFTKDGSYFIVAVESTIRIHSATTGVVISTLDNSTPNAKKHNEHPGTLTAAFLNPTNPFQLITGSFDGYIKIWDILDATLLQTIDIDQPIIAMCAHEHFNDSLFVAVERPTKKKSTQGNEMEPNCAVLRVSLKSTPETVSSPFKKSSKISGVGKTRYVTDLAVSPDGKWLVAIAGFKAYVAMTSSLKSGFTKFISPDRLTCLAFHPGNEYFVTGDAKGVIRSWYCLNDEVLNKAVGVEKKAQTTTMHWHANPVSSLSFTPNGAYLLSGGEEAVLVIWQMSSGKKEFVPRVGGPIRSVTVSTPANKDQEYLLLLEDTSFVFISSTTLKISRIFTGVKLDTTGFQPSTSVSPPFAIHQPSSTLIFPSSHPSSLQMYAPSVSKLVAELEVSPSNRVTKSNDQYIEPLRVTKTVVSPSGEWMATIDQREGDESFRPEIYMKLWQWDAHTNTWSLNTRIDRPHGSESIEVVLFSPHKAGDHGIQLATIGRSKSIKTWRIQQRKEDNAAWTSRSTFAFKSEVPKHLAWSSDASLLAVMFASCVVLYEPTMYTQLAILKTSEPLELSSAYFVGPSGRYLVVAAKGCILLWDVITQQVQWRSQIPSAIQSIIVNPNGESFIVSLVPTTSKAETQFLFFDVLSSQPRSNITLPFKFITLAYYALSPRSSFHIVGITPSWKVVVFGKNLDVSTIDPSKHRGISADSSNVQKRTLFQDIFGSSAFKDLTALDDTSAEPKPGPSSPGAMVTAPATLSTVSESFSAPAYLMPPMETLYDSLIGPYLGPRVTAKPTAGPEDHLQQGDEEDEDGDAMDISPERMAPNRDRRVVSGEEMDNLSRLFAIHAIDPTGKAAHSGYLSLEEAMQAASNEAFRYRERKRAEKAKRAAAEEERKAKKEKKMEERKAQEAERQAAELVNGATTTTTVATMISSENSDENIGVSADPSIPRINGKTDKTKKRKKLSKE